MAKKVRIEFNTEGFRELLQSSEVKGLVEEHTNAILDRAGGEEAGFSASVWEAGYGGGRWAGTVRTASYDAARAEATDKTLTKAVTG